MLRLLACLAFVACSPTVWINGVPNLAQVDTNIWRAGQIATQEGWNWIAQLASGRKVHVIKLNFDTEGSDALALQMGFDVVYVPIQPEGDQDVVDDVLSTFRAPDAANIARAKSVLTSCKLHPDTDFCIVHCTHGQDRTGLVTGEHRVENDGWTKQRAYDEMRAHHFHPELHGLYETWENFKSP